MIFLPETKSGDHRRGDHSAGKLHVVESAALNQVSGIYIHVSCSPNSTFKFRGVFGRALALVVRIAVSRTVILLPSNDVTSWGLIWTYPLFCHQHSKYFLRVPQADSNPRHTRSKCTITAF